jgi:hypothetical protein
MRYKSIPTAIAVKDIDAKQGIVCGYANTFDRKDADDDITRKGCFAKTLAEWGPTGKGRIKHVWQHQVDQILGAPRVLQEDAKGLYFENQIVPTALGKDVILLYEAGAITEHSIGYQVIQSQYDSKAQARILTELRLFEFSSVTLGSNEDTPVVGLKRLDGGDGAEAIAAQAERIDSLLRNGDIRTDGVGETLTRYLKQLKGLLPPPAEPERPVIITTEAKPMNGNQYQRPTDHKARDFNTLFQSLAQSDDLQDEWGDMFIAFTHAISEVMWQQHAQANGWLAPDAPKVDAEEAIQANMGDFTTALLDLVARSLQADFTPMLDSDGDQFLDPDGCNAEDSDTGYMSDTRPRDQKAGRSISSANRDRMYKALDSIESGHKDLKQLLADTEPSVTGDDTQDGAEKSLIAPATPDANGVGDGAASTDALDSQTTPSSDDDQLSEGARVKLLMLRADMLRHQLEKVG